MEIKALTNTYWLADKIRVHLCNFALGDLCIKADEGTSFDSSSAFQHAVAWALWSGGVWQIRWVYSDNGGISYKQFSVQATSIPLVMCCSCFIHEYQWHWKLSVDLTDSTHTVYHLAMHLRMIGWLCDIKCTFCLGSIRYFQCTCLLWLLLLFLIRVIDIPLHW